MGKIKNIRNGITYEGDWLEDIMIKESATQDSEIENNSIIASNNYNSNNESLAATPTPSDEKVRNNSLNDSSDGHDDFFFSDFDSNTESLDSRKNNLSSSFSELEKYSPNNNSFEGGEEKTKEENEFAEKERFVNEEYEKYQSVIYCEDFNYSKDICDMYSKSLSEIQSCNFKIRLPRQKLWMG